jgi:hypothetical protein
LAKVSVWAVLVVPTACVVKPTTLNETVTPVPVVVVVVVVVDGEVGDDL